MDNLNKSAEKVQRACTTPERMRLVQSIKKSIHRSIEKINPADYKNILKGQFIFMHLCHKGQIINSEYTKVALFMGAIVFKKAVQKITAIVTNDTSNKIVKKLALMGKPILSVLWLQACFQQKRKVPYQDFLYQDDAKIDMVQVQKQQQITANFDSLINSYQSNLTEISKQFTKNHNLKFLRFVDKKQKQKMDKQKNKIIPIHQIDIGTYVPQRRKSQTITDRVCKKKNQKKKVDFKDKQIKSQGLENQQKQTKFKSVVGSKNNIDGQQIQKIKIQTRSQYKDIGENDKKGLHQDQVQSKKQNQRLNKNVYQKYLKDFKNYEDKIKMNIQPVEEPFFNQAQDATPCFLWFDQQNNHQNYNTQNYQRVQTPAKISQKLINEQLLQTYSIKKQRTKNIKINIINPMNSQKIQKINHAREMQHMPLLEIAGNDSKNIACVISKQSKIEAILAMLSKPRLIVTQSFIYSLQRQPITDITQQFYKKFQIKCKLNINEIQGKKIVLLDSVMGVASLSKIIKQCNATVISISQFFFQKDVDFVITNKKMYLKVEKKQYKVLCETDFIDMLICFQK